MKTFFSIITLSSISLLAASANAQILIAGWDASIYSQAANTINNQTLTGAVASNYSQLEAQTASGPNSRGVFYYDGTNGSDNLIGNGQNGGLVPVDTSLNSNRIIGDGTEMSASGTYNVLLSNGQLFAQDLKIRFTTDSSFVIFADASSPVTGWGLSFAGQDSGGATINFSAGTDGSNFASDLGSVKLNAQDRAYSVDASSLDGASSVYIRGTFTGIQSAAFVDNFQVVGQVIPEPSTYVLMLLGVGLIGFVARKRK